ncbi:MAG: hypothetical protein HY608_09155 [Planctomycetes bacterium]|nr:hypothetical protein [Planctomycetota bacterium]
MRQDGALFSDRVLVNAAGILDALSPDKPVLPQFLRELLADAGFGFLDSVASGISDVCSDTRFRGIPMDLPSSEFLRTLADSVENMDFIKAILCALLEPEPPWGFQEEWMQRHDDLTEYALDLASRRARLRESLHRDGYAYCPEARCLREETNRMCLKGRYWHITYNGASLPPLGDSGGMRCVAHLLENPDRPVGILNLAVVANGRSPLKHSGVEGTRQDLQDPETMREIKRRYQELVHDQTEAKEAGAPQHQMEDDEESARLQALVHQATGLGGGSRPFTGVREQARSNLTKQIRSAIKKIAAANTALGHVLDTTVRTGADCEYRPDPMNPVVWVIEK